ncbi:MAG TPA: hypothetical protein VFV67_27415 [Actinophytocola sp.]|uniref:hypothetical protein n=1 Tax=Actinophytocola sp. TaxID=1872138 RepID=UPI002DBBD99F|nr:hypothetical protein [Actinophytocola sp.]HEU5474393.1 hypothetical protein [Actinophytocola sp.]
MGRGSRKARRSPNYDGPGRSELGPRRDPVYADDVDPWGDEDPGPGPAGVREPRRPKPNGPLSAAGELPVPEPPTYLRLADARR